MLILFGCLGGVHPYKQHIPIAQYFQVFILGHMLVLGILTLW